MLVSIQVSLVGHRLDASGFKHIQLPISPKVRLDPEFMQAQQARKQCHLEQASFVQLCLHVAFATYETCALPTGCVALAWAVIGVMGSVYFMRAHPKHDVGQVLRIPYLRCWHHCNGQIDTFVCRAKPVVRVFR